MRKKTPLYIVGIPSKRVCYEGNSRFLAWVSWMLNKRSGALAFDCGGWIITPSYWLRGGKPETGFFCTPITKNSKEYR